MNTPISHMNKPMNTLTPPLLHTRRPHLLKSDVEVCSDAVELFGRSHGVISELVHVSLDESVGGVGGENPVDETLVARLASPARPTVASHREADGRARLWD